MIGLIGLVLDLLVRRLENFDEVRWGYANRREQRDDHERPRHRHPQLWMSFPGKHGGSRSMSSKT